MPDVVRFLKHLHRGGKWAYLWTPEGLRSAWYPVGRRLPALGSGARNIYFGVHPTNEIPRTNSRGERVSPDRVRARKSYVAAVNCLFAEFDAHNPGDDKRALLDRIAGLDPPPSVIVDSGGGYHCYWLLAETFEIETEQDRRWIDSLQKGWVAYAGGDEGAKDLARMLRLPGTRNCKYAPPRPVGWIKHDLDQTYALSELERRARAAAPKRCTVGDRERAVRQQPTLALLARTAAWLDRLASWRCDEYEPWIEVGMSLSELGDLGLALWDLWSQRSDKYEPGVCVQKWGTFTPGDGLTLGSLHYWADEDDPRPEDTGSQQREPKPAAVHSDLPIQRLGAGEVSFVQDPLPQLCVEIERS